MKYYDEYCVYLSLLQVPSDLLSNIRSIENSTNKHENEAEFRELTFFGMNRKSRGIVMVEDRNVAPIVKLVLTA